MWILSIQHTYNILHLIKGNIHAGMNLFSILSAPFVICFFTTITFAIHDHGYRTGDISINCGSNENFAAVDGREWIGDDKHEQISPFVQVNGSSTSSSIASGQIVSADQAQYKTARISRSRFSYAFQLNPGHKFIRLHFNPISYRGFEGSKDLFTVEAGRFTLVRNFSASLTAGALGGKGKSFVKEFLRSEIERRNQLPWTLCFKLIIGIARGVRFLHQSPDLRTIYCSIDPCNIFLDTGMNPKIAIECCKPTSLEVMKTSDYAAPEGCHVNQRYSLDVYSFGVIVLEIVSGWKHRRSKQHLNLIAYAWKLWLGGTALDLVNTKMGSRYSSEEAITCIQIALLCTQFEPQHRPEMSLVLRALYGDQDLDVDMREAANRRYNPHV